MNLKIPSLRNEKDPRHEHLFPLLYFSMSVLFLESAVNVDKVYRSAGHSQSVWTKSIEVQVTLILFSVLCKAASSDLIWNVPKVYPDIKSLSIHLGGTVYAPGTCSPSHPSPPPPRPGLYGRGKRKRERGEGREEKGRGASAFHSTSSGAGITQGTHMTCPQGMQKMGFLQLSMVKRRGKPST